MVLAKCTRDFHGAGDVMHRLGEVLRIDPQSHLIRIGYAQPLDDETQVCACSCGRLFLVSMDPADPEQNLNSHILELGKGHKKAEVREKVPA